MKKLTNASLPVLVFVAVSLLGCSHGQEKSTEKGAVEKMTDEVARQAVDQARIPLEKAQALRSQEEERLKGAADATKE